MGIHLPNQGGKAPTGTLNGSKLSIDVHVSNQVADAIPVSATIVDNTNGTPGAAVPAEAKYIAGNNGGTLRGVAVNGSGEIQVDGLGNLATETTLGNVETATNNIDSTLATISANQLPASLGQASMANSSPVVIASDQSAVPVSAASLPLPTGAATETTLSAINTKTPALVSGRVPVDGSGVTQPISAASLPLPSGAATEATLAAMSAKLPAALGQLAMAASVSVAIASDQSAVPVSAASLPLPSGASTEATLSALNGKFSALGQNNMAGSAPVVIASDQSTLPVSAASLPLPTGASTEATLSALNAKFGALGQAAMAASAPVVIASDQTAIPISNLPATADTNLGTPSASTVRVAAMLGLGSAAVSSSNPLPVSGSKGRSVVTTVRNDYSSTNVTTGAWVELIASTASEINELSIFDSSGETLELGTGAAASETRLMLIFPGGNGREPVQIPSGTRVSIRAVSATASVGELDINFYS